jgi:hypothetical protein
MRAARAVFYIVVVAARRTFVFYPAGSGKYFQHAHAADGSSS